jgi:hypothetical protein
MSKKTTNSFRLFFVSRALSTFGDQTWEVALPLYFSTLAYSAEQMGLYSTGFSIGTLAGFSLLPKLSSIFPSSKITIAVDGVQLLIFALIALVLTSGMAIHISLFFVFAILFGFASSIWFGAAEATTSQIVGSEGAQSFHRFNYLATTFGPFVAPIFGSTIFFVFGLGIIAFFNALTFGPQIFAVKGFSKIIEDPTIKQNSAQNTRESLFEGVLKVVKHPYYGPLMVVSSFVKIALVGALPFIAFVLSKKVENSILLGGCLAAFPLGSFLGALSYKSKSSNLLMKSYMLDSVIMFCATAVLIIGLKIENLALPVLSAVIAGIFSARYTIAIRAMRQMISKPSEIPTLVSIQGLTSRIITPLSGILFGLLFSKKSDPSLSVFFGILIVVIGTIFILISARGFKTFVKS